MAVGAKQLLDEKILARIPGPGDIISGTVLYMGKNEVHVDIPGFRAGIVRGPEFAGGTNAYPELKVGDMVEATVLDLENERGLLELSFRFIGEKRSWEQVEAIRKSGEVITVKITEANKGGLVAKINNLPAFMPVSQLANEHYPRVGRHEQSKIVEKLRAFINKQLQIQIITVDPIEKKLIMSERAASEAAARVAISKFNVGDIVDGEVIKLTDYGAYIKFELVEGFVHLSEVSWGLVEKLEDFLKVGDNVKVQIIGIDGVRVILSIKRLAPDPWQNVGEKFKVSDVVKGKVLRANPYGLFVEVDKDIHGLAHISELGEGVKDPLEVAKIGDELEFKIIALEPENHKLSLSLKALHEKKETDLKS